MEGILDLLKPILETLAGSNGTVLQVLVLMASLRLIFKPLQELVAGYVQFTPTKKDDEWLAGLREKGWYKTMIFFLDWFASIKLPGRSK